MVERNNTYAWRGVTGLLCVALLACGQDEGRDADPADATDAQLDGSADDTAPNDVDPADLDTPDGSDPGLDGPHRLRADATVFRDQTGALHIYASNRQDLFFLQGYESARDRIFQLDALRLFIQGRQAAVFGEAFYEDDLTMRALNLYPIAAQNLAHYEANHPEVIAALTAYADGVNAYLDAMRAGRDDAFRPSEFDRIAPDYSPPAWELVDSVAIAKALILSQSFQADVELAVFAGRLLQGEESFADLYPFAPMFGTHILEEAPTPFSAVEYGPALQAKSLRPPVLALPAEATQQDRAAIASALGAMSQALGRAGRREEYGMTGGSNAWALADSLTDGGAILCNDTHMMLDQPSQLYPIHLVDTSVDEIGVVGYSVPGTPMVLIGNTQHVAWGLTNPFADVNDVYRETVRNRGAQVRFNGEFVDTVTRNEQIEVLGEDGTRTMREVTLRTVPWHGPLLNDLLPPEVGTTLANFGIYLSVNWTGFAPDTTELVTFLQMLDARDLDNQVEALRAFNGGVISWTLADASGRIGYVPAGAYPVRARPLMEAPPYLPFDGTGRDEWQGRVPFDDIPRLLDPAKGYVVNANAAIGPNVLNGEPADGGFYFGHFFDLGTRAWRITERIEALKAAGPISFDVARAIQLDQYSILGEIFAPLLVAQEAALCPEDAPASRACDAVRLVADWDLQQSGESAASAIYNVWVLHLWHQTYVDDVDDLVFTLTAPDMDNTAARALSFWLRGRSTPSGADYWDDSRTPDVVETADDIAQRALTDALVQLVEFFGETTPVTDYRWDAIHLTRHPHIAYPDLDAAPRPQNSGMRTVDAADYRLYENGQPHSLPYRQNEASQIRYCVQLGGVTPQVQGGLNGSVAGHVDQPGWGDQLDGWTAGVTYAVPVSRADVEAAATWTATRPAGFPAE